MHPQPLSNVIDGWLKPHHINLLATVVYQGCVEAREDTKFEDHLQVPRIWNQASCKSQVLLGQIGGHPGFLCFFLKRKGGR